MKWNGTDGKQTEMEIEYKSIWLYWHLLVQYPIFVQMDCTPASKDASKLEMS